MKKKRVLSAVLSTLLVFNTLSMSTYAAETDTTGVTNAYVVGEDESDTIHKINLTFTYKTTKGVELQESVEKTCIISPELQLDDVVKSFDNYEFKYYEVGEKAISDLFTTKDEPEKLYGHIEKEKQDIETEESISEETTDTSSSVEDTDSEIVEILPDSEVTLVYDYILEERSLETTIDDYKISVSGDIPQKAELKVEKLNSVEDYEELVRKETDNEQYKVYVVFDISIIVDGEVWQPADYDKKVKVNVENITVEEDDKLKVYHINEEDETVDRVEASLDEETNTVVFDAESFSPYVFGGDPSDDCAYLYEGIVIRYLFDRVFFHRQSGSMGNNVYLSSNNISSEMKGYLQAYNDKYNVGWRYSDVIYSGNIGDYHYNFVWLDEPIPENHFYDVYEIANTDKGLPVYMTRLDSMTVGFYTTAEHVYLNENSSYLFGELYRINLEAMTSFFSKIDASNCIYANQMFYSALDEDSVTSGIRDFSILDLSNVKEAEKFMSGVGTDYQTKQFDITAIKFSALSTQIDIPPITSNYDDAEYFWYLDDNNDNTPDDTIIRNVTLADGVAHTYRIFEFAGDNYATLSLSHSNFEKVLESNRDIIGFDSKDNCIVDISFTDEPFTSDYTFDPYMYTYHKPENAYHIYARTVATDDDITGYTFNSHWSQTGYVSEPETGKRAKIELYTEADKIYIENLENIFHYEKSSDNRGYTIYSLDALNDERIDASRVTSLEHLFGNGCTLTDAVDTIDMNLNGLSVNNVTSVVGCLGFSASHNVTVKFPSDFNKAYTNSRLFKVPEEELKSAPLDTDKVLFNDSNVGKVSIKVPNLEEYKTQNLAGTNYIIQDFKVSTSLMFESDIYEGEAASASDKFGKEDIINYNIYGSSPSLAIRLNKIKSDYDITDIKIVRADIYDDNIHLYLNNLANGVFLNGHKDDIKTIKLRNVSFWGSTASAFKGCSSLETVEMIGFMDLLTGSHMFEYCPKLKYVYMNPDRYGYMDGGLNITNMSYMFANQYTPGSAYPELEQDIPRLTVILDGDWSDTQNYPENITNASHMFENTSVSKAVLSFLFEHRENQHLNVENMFSSSASIDSEVSIIDELVLPTFFLNGAEYSKMFNNIEFASGVLDFTAASYYRNHEEATLSFKNIYQAKPYSEREGKFIDQKTQVIKFPDLKTQDERNNSSSSWGWYLNGVIDNMIPLQQDELFNAENDNTRMTYINFGRLAYNGVIPYNTSVITLKSNLVNDIPNLSSKSYRNGVEVTNKYANFDKTTGKFKLYSDSETKALDLETMSSESVANLIDSDSEYTTVSNLYDWLTIYTDGLKLRNGDVNQYTYYLPDKDTFGKYLLGEGFNIAFISDITSSDGVVTLPAITTQDSVVQYYIDSDKYVAAQNGTYTLLDTDYVKTFNISDIDTVFPSHVLVPYTEDLNFYNITFKGFDCTDINIYTSNLDAVSSDVLNIADIPGIVENHTLKLAKGLTFDSTIESAFLIEDEFTQFIDSFDNLYDDGKIVYGFYVKKADLKNTDFEYYWGNDYVDMSSGADTSEYIQIFLPDKNVIFKNDAIIYVGYMPATATLAKGIDFNTMLKVAMHSYKGNLDSSLNNIQDFAKLKATPLEEDGDDTILNQTLETKILSLSTIQYDVCDGSDGIKQDLGKMYYNLNTHTEGDTSSSIKNYLDTTYNSPENYIRSDGFPIQVYRASYPAHSSYHNEAIVIASRASTLYANEDSSYLYSGLNNIYRFQKYTDGSGWDYSNRTLISSLYSPEDENCLMIDNSQIKDASYMFYNVKFMHYEESISSLGSDYIDNIFQHNPMLTNLHPTNAEYMFAESDLVALPILDLSSVTSLRGFCYNSSVAGTRLEEAPSRYGNSYIGVLDLSQFQLSSDVILDDAFAKCTDISSLYYNDNLDYFGERMFDGDAKLTSLDNVSHVTDIREDAFRLPNVNMTSAEIFMPESYILNQYNQYGHGMNFENWFNGYFNESFVENRYVRDSRYRSVGCDVVRDSEGKPVKYENIDLYYFRRVSYDNGLYYCITEDDYNRALDGLEFRYGQETLYNTSNDSHVDEFSIRVAHNPSITGYKFVPSKNTVGTALYTNIKDYKEIQAPCWNTYDWEGSRRSVMIAVVQVPTLVMTTTDEDASYDISTSVIKYINDEDYYIGTISFAPEIGLVHRNLRVFELENTSEFEVLTTGYAQSRYLLHSAEAAYLKDNVSTPVEIVPKEEIDAWITEIWEDMPEGEFDGTFEEFKAQQLQMMGATENPDGTYSVRRTLSGNLNDDDLKYYPADIYYKNFHFAGDESEFNVQGQVFEPIVFHYKLNKDKSSTVSDAYQGRQRILHWSNMGSTPEYYLIGNSSFVPGWDDGGGAVLSR